MLSKKFNHKRLRPKASSKNKPKINQQERDYLQWFNKQNFSCLICNTKAGVEGHHVKRDSLDKKNHKRIIPLCRVHHHGTVLSPHGTPVLFRRHYEMEFQYRLADGYYAKYKETL